MGWEPPRTLKLHLYPKPHLHIYICEGSILTDGDLLKIATELWPLIAGEKCVAWVGSGLSKIAGFPGWSEVVSQLCIDCGVQDLEESEKSSADKLIDKAEECKRADQVTYQDTLANIFGQPIVGTRFALSSLMTLPFKGFVTTNFDALLGSTGATHGYNSLYSYPSLPLPKLEVDTKPIFYVHGLARHGNDQRGDRLIFARSEFDEAYGNNGIVSSFLTQMLTYYDVLFIGCSLEEPDIYKVFEKVHQIHQRIKDTYQEAIPPQRYILLSSHQTIKENTEDKKDERKKMIERSEETRLSEMNVKILRYVPSDEKHGEIEQIVGHLCNLAEKPVTPLPLHGLGEEEPI